MGSFIDITGKRFGRLTVIEKAERVGLQVAWKCVCDCGGSATVISANIRRGHTQSCGCLHRETTAIVGRVEKHGLSRTAEYTTWQQIQQRCSNPKTIGWKHYGGKGITVCSRWVDSFENFIADMGNRPLGCSIDRIDPSMGYEPTNCRWLDLRVNSLRALPNTRHLVEGLA